MATRSIRIIMDGVTGRLGTNQHLGRSLMAIRRDGGLPLADGDRLMPEPVLLGRNTEKLQALAAANGGLAWSTDRAACLADPAAAIYFDVSATGGRHQRALAAIAAGKHVYLEKPVASTVEEALEIARAAEAAGGKHGVVQDKIYLPGFMKLKSVMETGLLGRVLSARLDFGWWIFDGVLHPAQRSSWNYKRAEGGGLVLDMFPHWRYIVEHLLGPIRSVSCRVATRVPERRDENGRAYAVDVEDEAFGTFELDGGVLVQVSASWNTRVKGEDMLTMKVDGSMGSATCSLHRAHVQPLATTPKPRWDVDALVDNRHAEHWQEVPDMGPYTNSYRRGWEMFLRHVAEGAPFPSPLLAGAKGLQLIDACYRSDRERRWIDLPALTT
ncbi:Gfo/Idh/MocA family oxidoreductase [Roseomonas stagni]|uniref:Gfo/Idh/MocA family oxidoreductase n=1 Tax=Falsiroseomonas algicola TaxID=2716930 RepID=A0A6M1LHI3_9PROT|nr:Gfo/Idh/MocA family oxidoreductase [Falsiroseomonas algicola]NGM19825.1 Gfo/Idh/MocA family oxidoreductase [Falsiroseomonas algicola]